MAMDAIMTWDELTREEIDEMLSAGLKDIAEGRTFSQEEVDAHMRERFARRIPLTTV